jgi:hypothetical protein
LLVFCAAFLSSAGAAIPNGRRLVKPPRNDPAGDAVAAVAAGAVFAPAPADGLPPTELAADGADEPAAPGGRLPITPPLAAPNLGAPPLLPEVGAALELEEGEDGVLPIVGLAAGAPLDAPPLEADPPDVGAVAFPPPMRLVMPPAMLPKRPPNPPA